MRLRALSRLERGRMQANMLEIYNEEYRDLLGAGPPQGKKHQVRLRSPRTPLPPGGLRSSSRRRKALKRHQLYLQCP